MNEIVIQKAGELIPVSRNGELVLTTKQLAEFFATSRDNIKHNFSRNRARFVEGVHYFKLEGVELDKLRRTESHLQISSSTRRLYLWTKQGVVRHCKSIDTEMAWQVFGVLEQHYFAAHQRISQGTKNPRQNLLQGTKNPRQNLLQGTKNPSQHEQINTRLKCAELLVKCIELTDNPKLRDSLIRKVATLFQLTRKKNHEHSDKTNQ